MIKNLTFSFNCNKIPSILKLNTSYQEWRRDWPYEARQPAESLHGANSSRTIVLADEIILPLLGQKRFFVF